MEIAFLHTADVHVQTFDALLDELGYSGKRTHMVMPELLQRARGSGLEGVRAEVLDVLAELAAADAVMCTCSTIGPVADEFSRKHDHVFRIDRPAMEEACTHGPDVLVAICLESTRNPSLELLGQCADRLQADVAPRVLLCDAAWPHFERGDLDAFAAAIADEIRSEVMKGKPDCIVLAQASMRVAEGRLSGLGLPVISSPARAAARAISIAEGRHG